MAKGQKHSNKEIRKPKQDKQPKAAAPTGNSSPFKTPAPAGAAPKKK